MIGRHLRDGHSAHGHRVALVHGNKLFHYNDIWNLVNASVKAWADLSNKRVGVCIGSPLSFIVTLIALDLLQSHAFLVGSRCREEVQGLRHRFTWDHTLCEEDVRAMPLTEEKERKDSSEEVAGLVTILTSGTTGAPKAVNHTWTTLASPVRKDNRYTDARWLLSYPLNLYAGTQVFLHAFLNWATLVVPESAEPGTICRTLKENRITHASGTPTFWRQLLFFGCQEALQGCELEQITLGGEVATQELLGSLRITFPRARLVHIYASTELGRLFSVTDGREGFPTRFLQEPPEEGIALRILDGELLARGHHRMISYDRQMPLGEQSNGWMATGDLVEVCGDRVLFTGRRNDVINVGGRKVSPLRVEATLRGLPGIIDVRVYAKKSSVTGHLVAADVVLAPGVSAETMNAELRQAASRTLQAHEVPRIVRVVPEMVINEAIKIVRSEPVE